ncbi:uncharacterized protein TNCT_91851 [Trichonephila clavata]|uniref:Sushi domain-containing protein n=1 Tax=Trichonephila clavata TaxID=2740835 RepID=A0A8X6LCN5_TRICU|nr:uncharacterized protein TNCT_91851 [Trichonephila clavata]
MAVASSVLFLFLTATVALAGEPVVNCPAPRSPDHGQAFLYQDGRVVKFVCEPGYSLQGKEIVRCVEGEWEEGTPSCIEIAGDGEVQPDIPPPPEQAPTRPLFNWGGDEDEENATATVDGEEMPLSDEARLRMVIYPRRRARVLSARVARLHSTAELEEEEKKRSAKKDDSGSSRTTIHLEGPPSVVYVRRTVSPGKSDSQEQTLKEQYRTASVHMTVENKEDVDKVNVVALPRAAVAPNDKGDESLRHMYWMAQQYYPRQSSLVEYRSGNPVVMTLSESQMAWINSLHPELRDQYLRDLYVLRAEEAAEGTRALAFLRRYDDPYNIYAPLYLRQPVVSGDITSLYDYSCNQAGSHFVTAPKLPNAHIGRYDRRQNPNAPYNHYLTAVYRCNPGYIMLDTRFTELTCSKRNWIGTEPICVPRS